MAFKAHKLKDPLRWEYKHLDIIEGNDIDTGRYYFDIVYHGTDVGLIYVSDASIAHLMDMLDDEQARILMESMAELYVLGYEKAREDAEDAIKHLTY